jgi:transposase
MILLGGIRNYYLYRNAVDMRKSFYGLGGLVRNEMNREMGKGEGYLFFNKRKTMVKLLIWEGTSFVLYCKKLVEGTFEIPESSLERNHVEIAERTFMLMMEGVSLKNIKMRKRYEFGIKESRA